MSVTWVSGARQRILEVCRGDLVTVRLRFVRSLDRDETPTAEGLAPHLVYQPVFEGRDGGPGSIGGDTPTGDLPLEYRVDLDPLWCPYPGTLYLDGGGSRLSSLPNTYTVSYTRTRCAPRPEKDPTFTLLTLRPGAAFALPLGVYAATTPRPEIVRFDFNGMLADMSLDRSPTYLGTFSQGTVTPSPFGSAQIDMCSFRVKL